MASTQTLTVNSLPLTFDTMYINLTDGTNPIILSFVFKTISTTIGDIKIGSTTTEQATLIAVIINKVYGNTGGTGNISAVAIGSDVVITNQRPDWTFNAPSGSVIGSRITYVTNNDTPTVTPKLTHTGWSAYVTAPCDSIYGDFTAVGGNNSYNIYVNTVLYASAQTSPFSVLLPRGVLAVIEVRDTTGLLINVRKLIPPAKIIASNISVDVQNFSSGATLTVSVDTFITNEPLEYALNAPSGWQTSNIFTGQLADTYTIYVKDAYGCETASDPVVVDGVTSITETKLVISEINALRFAILQDGAKKNHKNTISCGEVKQISYPFVHKYLQTDLITTQFKANAQYLSAFTLDKDGNMNAQTLNQMTANIGNKARSTCTMFSLGNGRSAIYFGLVDMLDYDTGAFVEEADFGFALPEWADTKGDPVFIDGIGELIIDAISYSDDYDAFVIEFTYNYSGAPVQKDLKAIYNLQPYEVYEFTLDMNAEPTEFYVIIEAGIDSNNIDYTYVSEKVKRTTDSDSLLEIIYYNDVNVGDMVYQTGIQHLLRLDGYWDYIGEQKTEGYDGDSEYYVTDNTIYDSQKFSFPRLSSEMAAKMRLVVAHNYLKINGLFYKLSEVPEIETKQTNNFKLFNVTLKRSGDQFLANVEENIDVSKTGESISAAIEASKGKAMLLWTKING